MGKENWGISKLEWEKYLQSDSPIAIHSSH